MEHRNQRRPLSWQCGRLLALALGSLLSVSCAAATPRTSTTAPPLVMDQVATGVGAEPLNTEPRVILPAPAPRSLSALSDDARASGASETSADANAVPRAEAPAAAPVAPAPAAPGVRPTDSPLLAFYDNVPHGSAPAAQIDPLFLPRARGWTTPRPSYGYAPYSYGGYGYRSYSNGYRPYGYGYPGYVYPGIGFGLGLGWPYGARSYGYRGGQGFSGSYRSGGYRSGVRHFGGHHGGHRR